MHRCALLLLLAATAAGAQDTSEPAATESTASAEPAEQAQPGEQTASPVFDYLFLQGGYQFSTSLDSGPDSNGFGFGGSLPIGESMFFTADYSSSRTQPFNIGAVSGRVLSTAVSFGFGAHRSLSPRLDLTGSASYISASIRGQDGFALAQSEQDNALGAGASLRWLLRPRLEIAGGPGVTYTEGDFAWDVGAGLIVRLTRRLSLGLSSSVSEDSVGLGISLRTGVPVAEEDPANVERPTDESAPAEQTSP